MQLTVRALERIAAGEVDLAFRRWRRPTVRPGGRLRTPLGTLAVDEVTEVDPDDVTDEEARRAGYPDRAALLASLHRGDDRQLYRVAVRFAGPDERVALRDADQLDDEELAEVLAALGRKDSRSGRGPWTERVLSLVGERPGVRAPDLAATVGRETARFKADVRALKELGLTESLEVGYRLSPRGREVLRRLRERGTSP